MIAALIALAGVFVALYLTLYKLGYIGTLACGVGSCETVQTSRWATLLGAPVAVWGVGYYLGVLALTLVGLRGDLVDSRPLARVLVAVTATGVLFSLWLTYLELWVIHAICMWCVVSALLALALFVACLLDLRDLARLTAAEDVAARAAAGLRGDGWGRSIRNTEEVSIRAVQKDEEA